RRIAELRKRRTHDSQWRDRAGITPAFPTALADWKGTPGLYAARAKASTHRRGVLPDLPQRIRRVRVEEPREAIAEPFEQRLAVRPVDRVLRPRDRRELTHAQEDR